MYEDLEKQTITDLAQVNTDTDGYERFFKVEEGDVILDIGAHVGMFSRRHLNKAKHIYAVEPDPMFLKQLEKVDKYNFSVIPVGVAAEDGTSLIQSDGSAHTIGEGDTEIATMSFSNLVAVMGQIDFLKIDCEGAEYDIFTEDNIQWIKDNVKKIAGEFHIHTDKHKELLPFIFYQFELNNIDYILTSIDGVILSRDNVLGNLDYYKEINFFALTQDTIERTPIINLHYVDGCTVDIVAGFSKYNITIVDEDADEIVHTSTIGNKEWTKTNRKYFTNWSVMIEDEEGQTLLIQPFSLKDERVFICLESHSLGDTLAWFPYVEEFRKKHDCKMIVSTYMNNLFVDNYPDIEFVEPGVGVHNIKALYRLGWFHNEEGWDSNKHPANPRELTLQKTASDILGLEFREIKPKLTLPNVQKTNSVTIGMHSTAQAKYWNNPTGWQDVVNYVNSVKHIPYMLGKEGSDYMGNKYPKAAIPVVSTSINAAIAQICRSKVFVGIGSGLSWLAWACNTPVILISGFSEPYTEMSDCIRIGAPEGKCSGCFNVFELDKGDWNWCPVHKGTERQFECTKSITSEEVIEAIKTILN